MSLWALALIWAVAAVLVAVGVWRWRESRAFAASASRAQGVVVELVSGSSGTQAAAPLSYPVVRYRAMDGREVVFRSGFGSRPSLWRPGQTVTVLYDPADPQAARIESRAASVVTPGCFVAIGAVLAGSATLMFLFFRWADSLIR
jgi:Protein of unknown function (DUF3592)